MLALSSGGQVPNLPASAHWRRGPGRDTTGRTNPRGIMSHPIDIAWTAASKLAEATGVPTDEVRGVGWNGRRFVFMLGQVQVEVDPTSDHVLIDGAVWATHDEAVAQVEIRRSGVSP